MKIQYFFLIALCFLITNDMMSQSYAFGVKGGLTAATQRWNNFDSGEPLFALHGALYIESYNEENLSCIFAQAGYHARGRVTRFNRFVNQNGQEVPSQTRSQKFNNAALIIGVKKKLELSKGSTDNRGFYGFGVRAEYNISSELGFQSGFASSINRLTYGVTVNGGYEFMFSEFVGGTLEISVHPDLGRQIFVPQQVYFDEDLGQSRTLREQNVVNTSIEISLGIRLLHKITYID